MKTPPTNKITLSGTTRVLTLYSIGWLARMCNKSVLTVRKWEREQKLPKPLFLSDGDMRWYSASEIACYAALVRKHRVGRGRTIDQKFVTEAQMVQGRLREIFSHQPNSPKLLDSLPQEQMLAESILKLRKNAPNTDPWQIKAINQDPALSKMLGVDTQ